MGNSDVKRVAIMQPYFLPYVGYFQLLNSVDEFVFYDDVNFIKGGWINRNDILLGNTRQRIVIPCLGASPNKMINEVLIHKKDKKFAKTEKTLFQAYQKAKYFKNVLPILEKIFNSEEDRISHVAGTSVRLIAEYLNLDKTFHYSSEAFHRSRAMERGERLIEIVNELAGHTYINLIGGTQLYSQEIFQSGGLELKFLEPQIREYEQNSSNFHPSLSILDLLMNLSPEQVRQHLKLGVLH